MKAFVSKYKVEEMKMKDTISDGSLCHQGLMLTYKRNRSADRHKLAFTNRIYKSKQIILSNISTLEFPDPSVSSETLRKTRRNI